MDEKLQLRLVEALERIAAALEGQRADNADYAEDAAKQAHFASLDGRKCKCAWCS